MSLYKHDASDPGETGTWSPAKVSALLFGLAAPAPLVLFYLEVGPEHGLLTALAVSGGLAVLSAGLWWGLGRGAFRGFADALTRRVED